MTTIGPHPGGINNRAQPGRLPTSERGAPLFARNANNGSFNKEGNFTSRDTPVNVLPGLGYKDGYSCPAGSFFRDGSSIKKFSVDEQGVASADVIASGFIGKRIAWADFRDTVYFSDGAKTGKIVNGVFSNWGTPIPSAAPHLSGSSVMGSGQIMSCYSYLLEGGKESGTSPVATSSSGRVISGIETSQDNRVVAVKAYMTHPDNSTFYHVATLLPGVPSVEITTQYGIGQDASSGPMTLGRVPPVPGQAMCFHDGRVYIASGNLVYFSDHGSDELFSLGQTIATETADKGGFFACIWQFADNVNLLESVSNGIFVGADKTYFAPGSDPHNKNQKLVDIDDSIPILGSSVIDDNGDLLWHSTAGICTGGPGGRFDRKNYDNVSMDTPLKGEGSPSTIMNINGSKLMVTVPKSPVDGNLRGKGWQPDFINNGCGE